MGGADPASPWYEKCEPRSPLRPAAPFRMMIASEALGLAVRTIGAGTGGPSDLPSVAKGHQLSAGAHPEVLVKREDILVDRMPADAHTQRDLLLAIPAEQER